MPISTLLASRRDAFSWRKNAAGSQRCVADRGQAAVLPTAAVAIQPTGVPLTWMNDRPVGRRR
jgi:hypothetical protein